jgi:hypothetical protein
MLFEIRVFEIKLKIIYSIEGLFFSENRTKYEEMDNSREKNQKINSGLGP